MHCVPIHHPWKTSPTIKKKKKKQGSWRKLHENVALFDIMEMGLRKPGTKTLLAL